MEAKTTDERKGSSRSYPYFLKQILWIIHGYPFCKWDPCGNNINGICTVGSFDSFKECKKKMARGYGRHV